MNQTIQHTRTIALCSRVHTGKELKGSTSNSKGFLKTRAMKIVIDIGEEKRNCIAMGWQLEIVFAECESGINSFRT